MHQVNRRALKVFSNFSFTSKTYRLRKIVKKYCWYLPLGRKRLWEKVPQTYIRYDIWQGIWSKEKSCYIENQINHKNFKVINWIPRVFERNKIIWSEVKIFQEIYLDNGDEFKISEKSLERRVITLKDSRH